MTRRKIGLGICVTLLVVLGYFAYSVVYTIRHLPEAYAAWDTGTMLVTYMQRNEGRWPTGWDDLSTVVGENEPMLFLRGDEYPEENSRPYEDYIHKIQRMVKVDWNFQPRPGTKASPVTRLDGDPFPVVWSGAEPNEMVRSYINYRDANPDVTEDAPETDPQSQVK